MVGTASPNQTCLQLNTAWAVACIGFVSKPHQLATPLSLTATLANLSASTAKHPFTGPEAWGRVVAQPLPFAGQVAPTPPRYHPQARCLASQTRPLTPAYSCDRVCGMFFAAINGRKCMSGLYRGGLGSLSHSLRGEYINARPIPFLAYSLWPYLAIPAS